MPKRLILSDFDRTLFDTARFFEDIWDTAAELYDVNADTERDRAVDYRTYHQDLYDYDFFAHLKAAAGAKYDYDKFIAYARHRNHASYLFPDVTLGVIAMIDEIVTFGGSEFQRFKLSFCPELAHMKVHIILSTKGEYIAKHFSGQSVLIDDKKLEGEIRSPCTFVRIDRSQGAKNGAGVITSFADLASTLDMSSR